MKIISEQNTKENFHLNDSEIEYQEDRYGENLLQKLLMDRADHGFKRTSLKKTAFIQATPAS